MKLKISVKWFSLSALDEIGIRWRLDEPKSGKSVDADSIISIRGWAVTNNSMPLRIFLKKNKETVGYELNRPRPDVIRKVLLEEPEGHPQSQCGFEYDIQVDGNPVTIGFRINGKSYPLCEMKFRKAAKVLVGRRGNLFLDNDSNGCIEQYQGTYSIPNNELIAWKSYVESLSQLEHENSLRAVFLIAPGKEFVHSEDFPYARGLRTPVDQVIELFSKRKNIVYPLEELTSENDLTYSTTDTHWTDYGAMVAARAVCRMVGDDFPSDMPPFRLLTRTGDLAKKLESPVERPYFKADFSKTGVSLKFTNCIENHGRVHLYENLSSLDTKTMLIFGDSFSVNLVFWLSLCYRQVFYVHTAGSIDTKILEKIKPDVLIAQTNTRFLVRSPVIDLDFNIVVKEKLRKFTSAELQELRETVTARPESELRAWTLGLINAVVEKAAS